MHGELFLDAGFDLIETFGKFLGRAQDLAQQHEGAHDVDAHLDGAGAVEDGGGHDGAVLGECVRQELDVLATSLLQGHRL
jgi:hypothetical protein